MRVVRTRRHKLICNIAHQLPSPFAADRWAASTWPIAVKRGRAVQGTQRLEACLHRPRFGLQDLDKDPDEVVNLADPGAGEHDELLESLQAKLRAVQKRTGDPWKLKWRYE